jgi:hypothetical protein
MLHKQLLLETLVLKTRVRRFANVESKILSVIESYALEYSMKIRRTNYFHNTVGSAI